LGLRENKQVIGRFLTFFARMAKPQRTRPANGVPKTSAPECQKERRDRGLGGKSRNTYETPCAPTASVQGRRPDRSSSRSCNGASSPTSPLGPAPKTPVCAMNELSGEASDGGQAVATTRRPRARNCAHGLPDTEMDGSEAARRIMQDPSVMARVVVTTTFERTTMSLMRREPGPVCPCARTRRPRKWC
jgi:hypothetical protein